MIGKCSYSHLDRLLPVPYVEFTLIHGASATWLMVSVDLPRVVFIASLFPHLDTTRQFAGFISTLFYHLLTTVDIV